MTIYQIGWHEPHGRVLKWFPSQREAAAFTRTLRNDLRARGLRDDVALEKWTIPRGRDGLIAWLNEHATMGL